MSGSGTFDPNTVLAGINNMETSGRPTMGYHDLSRSTAAGPFGITDSTWAGLASAHPDLGLNVPGARMDYGKNRAASMALQQDNAADLGRRGVANPTDPLALTAANFLGPTAAAAVLQADPNAPIADILGRVLPRAQAAQFLASNPEQLGRGQTAGQVLTGIRQRMGQVGQAPAQGGPPAAQGGAMPGFQPMAVSQVQPTALPPMPADFGQPTADQMSQSGQAAQVPTSHAGDNNDLLLALGMGLMSGTSLPQGMQQASQNVSALQQRQLSAAQTNANLQNDAMQRQFQLPNQAANTANLRSEAWKNLNAPNAITPFQAAQLNNQAAESNNRLYAEAAQRETQRQYMEGLVTGKPEVLVDPGANEENPQVYTRQQTKDGTLTVKGPNGQTVDPSDPAMSRLIPQSLYTNPGADVLAQRKANVTAADKLATADSDAQTQNNRFQQALNALHPADGSAPNVTQGVLGTLGRSLDNAFGTSVFGNNTDTEIADKLLQQDVLGQFQNNAKNGQRVTNSLRDFIVNAQPHLGQNPQALEQLTKLLQQNNDVNSQINQAWQSLSPAARRDYMRNGSVDQWAASQRRAIMGGQPSGQGQPAASPAPQAAPAQSPTSAPAQPRPLSSFKFTQ